MADNRTRLQKLTDVLIGVNSEGNQYRPNSNVVTYNMAPSSDILYKTTDKAERDKKLLELKQERYLSYLWKKTGYYTAMEQIAGATQVKIMYRDADLMAQWPEIKAALHIVAEEATTPNKDGKILNIYSDSPRIKAVLEDLFVNRLDINLWARTIFFDTCKYGNDFMLLNIGPEGKGILGWRNLPTHEIQRVENGLQNAYGGGVSLSASLGNLRPDEVKFIWEGHNEQQPFYSWQIAHFRLIEDSLYLPYGVSYLNGVRRHWRMLSMMEDSMLLYRLERSVDRRVYKVNVGAIDDKDVPAFLEEFASKVKRAPIIDPETGQMDLRKNYLDVSSDYFIPVRNGQDPSSITPLGSLQNPTSMEDIQIMQNKILSGLRVPKAFLNFQEAQGKAQNLSLLDIRFNKMINGYQQSVLMELNKVAIIHLYLMGFVDDLTNFTLSFNNPSNQLKLMELDVVQKKLNAASAALTDNGSGLHLMSWRQVQKEIMGRTEAEISEMLDDMRFESALANELQKTSEIIKKTGAFSKVDNIYGEPNATYSDENGGEGGAEGLGGGMPGGFGGEMEDIGEGGDFGGGSPEVETGATGSQPLENAEPLLEVVDKPKEKDFKQRLNEYIAKNSNEVINSRIEILDKSLRINEEIESMLTELDHIGEETKKENVEPKKETKTKARTKRKK